MPVIYIDVALYISVMVYMWWCTCSRTKVHIYTSYYIIRQCKKQNQVCSGKSTGTQVESCKMCAGTCHLTAFCPHISPKWQFLHRHAGKSVPARKKLFRQCAGTRSPQQHPPPLTWLGCLVLGCPFGVCAGVLVGFFAPQPVKHVSIPGLRL